MNFSNTSDLGYVPGVDATGANIIVEFIKKMQKHQTKIILSNVKKQPRRVLHDAFLKDGIDSHVISTASNFENALKMTRRYLKKLNVAAVDNNSQKAVALEP